jgi:hypothetical protein
VYEYGCILSCVFCCSYLGCIVVVLLYYGCIVAVLCVLIVLCAYCCLYFAVAVCTSIAVCTLDAGLLARSQYSEGPATGHLDRFFLVSLCL